MTFKILPVFGHVELYINGKYYCTADTFSEALKEYNDYVKERLKVNENQSAQKELQHC
jgi:hypothetical protein